MSQENVEIVQAGNEAWTRGDWDGLRETYDPDVVMRTVEDWPEAGPHFGRDAVLRFFQQLRATWDINELETISLTEAGDRVVGHYVLHGVGRGPDARIEVANVVTFRRGRAVMIEYFWNHADAVEAVGLSQENVELVRGGIQSVEAFWALLDEYVVWDLRDRPMLDLDSVYIGRDAVVKASRHYWGTWQGYRLDAEEFIDAGSSVVVIVRERGRGKGSGAPFDQRWAQVWTFSRRRIIRWEVFPDASSALEAVGLSEQDAHADS